MAIFMWLMVMAPSSSYNMMQGKFIRSFGGTGWLWKELLEKRLSGQFKSENKPTQEDPALLNNAHGIAMDKRNNEAPELLTTSRMDSKLAIVFTVRN